MTASYQKELINGKQSINTATTSIVSAAVIKPIPQTLNRGRKSSSYGINPSNQLKNNPSPENIKNNNISTGDQNSNILVNKQPIPPTETPDHDGIEWWKNLLAEIDIPGHEEKLSEGLLLVSSSGVHNLDAERETTGKMSDQTSSPTVEATGFLEDGKDSCMHPKPIMSGNASKLRKGAWGSDEDTLLRRCIEEYGEEKWHLVPQRAGLNRCRKSCRLRWLNYIS
ncbi:hypothetical protein ACET3Z_010943 [Daucus carota]